MSFQLLNLASFFFQAVELFPGEKFSQFSPVFSSEKSAVNELATFSTSIS
jgi:hypothetical protein